MSIFYPYYLRDTGPRLGSLQIDVENPITVNKNEYYYLNFVYFIDSYDMRWLFDMIGCNKIYVERTYDAVDFYFKNKIIFDYALILNLK